MKRVLIFAVALTIVLSGCVSPFSTEDGARGAVEVDVVDQGDVPENATVVDADRVDPSQNDLDELFDEAIRKQEVVGKKYDSSTMDDIEKQLSPAPTYEHYHYLKYEGEVVKVATNYPR